ncbi:MAG: 3-deoxy-7-phosphoheptulonate synthase [Heliobacteriaceae bacterium]|nr:3-deoxy-7-phosphoheptulonate synthase [Heliobacteriaceae bacterium]MDD4587737.1 3-deoxy-7-phosphoheptulonate synthase [Heliobacteriaceae bacterium]
MIVVMELAARAEQIGAVQQKLVQAGYVMQAVKGARGLIIGAAGKGGIDHQALAAMPGVDRVVPVRQPYKLVSRDLGGETSLVKVKDLVIGGRDLTVIAGPCAVESWEQLLDTAQQVSRAGAVVLRGGAFKPRSSPYSFQGLEVKGLELLAAVGALTGLLTITEVVDEASLELALTYVDLVQIGSRNMQNFRLLQAVGRSGKPVLLKRGFAATVEEWLLAAEYIVASGNENVVLCERGIRTFEIATRNTLDLSAVALVKKRSHLPVMVDPSHATGDRDLVGPMARAAVAAGADGLIVEVHPDPGRALCDGAQSLTPEAFVALMQELQPVAAAVGRAVGGGGAL